MDPTGTTSERASATRSPVGPLVRSGRSQKLTTWPAGIVIGMNRGATNRRRCLNLPLTVGWIKESGDRYRSEILMYKHVLDSTGGKETALALH